MFSKKPASEARSVAGRNAATGAFSILGPDITIKGSVIATDDLHIDGTVEGDIACAALVQGEASTIAGDIAAESARLAGTVRGAIRTREVVILKTARIEGDVFYDALTIEQGAIVVGRLSPRGADLTSSGESRLMLASAG